MLRGPESNRHKSTCPFHCPHTRAAFRRIKRWPCRPRADLRTRAKRDRERRAGGRGRGGGVASASMLPITSCPMDSRSEETPMKATKRGTPRFGRSPNGRGLHLLILLGELLPLLRAAAVAGACSKRRVRSGGAGISPSAPSARASTTYWNPGMPPSACL